MFSKRTYCSCCITQNTNDSTVSATDARKHITRLSSSTAPCPRSGYCMSRTKSAESACGRLDAEVGGCGGYQAVVANLAIGIWVDCAPVLGPSEPPSPVCALVTIPRSPLYTSGLDLPLTKQEFPDQRIPFQLLTQRSDYPSIHLSFQSTHVLDQRLCLRHRGDDRCTR